MNTTSASAAGTDCYLAVQTPRQRLRTGLLLAWLLIMPITLYYFSPYLPFMGLIEGVISGSIFVFIGLLASATFFGRAFCGWLCPAGAVQEFASIAKPRRVNRRVLQWFKFGLWLPWSGAWFGLAVSVAGLRSEGLRPGFFFQMEHGVSVSRPGAYIIYLAVLTLILVLSLTIGRRGFCHTSCWIAPFMILGLKIGMMLRVPGVYIQSDASRCSSCGTCSRACPMSLDIGSLACFLKPENVEGKPIRIAHHDCILCMRCVDVCPNKTLALRIGDRT